MEEKAATRMAELLCFAVLCGMLVLGLVLCLGARAGGGGGTAQDGWADVSSYRKDDPRMLYLDGTWMAYPGQLVISEGGGGESIPVQVPDSRTHPVDGSISYQLRLAGQREESRLMVTFPGLMCDYEVFVDGQPEEVYSIAPNFLQFVVLHGAGSHEVTVEIRNAGGVGMDICPIAMDVNVLFRWIFGVRSALLTFLGIMLSAFIVFPILYGRGKIVARELKPYFLIGILAMLLYIGQTVWFYGVLDLWEQIIPLRLIPVLTGMIFTLMILAMIWHMRVICPQQIRRWDVAAGGSVLILTGVALVVRYLWGAAPANVLFTLCAALTAGFLLYTVIRCALGRREAPLLFVFGDLALLAGTSVSFLSGYDQVAFPDRVALPTAMVLFLLCWNLAVAQNRRREAALLREALGMEQRLARTQAAFLASQIQPHFLYNALTTIQELCYTDPELAAGTVVRLSEYLRNNIDFMEYQDKVPFSIERTHIENYIALQRARFSDAVTFVTCFEAEDFCLPPLTVQPLVENAVIHGVRKRENGRGTVSVLVWRDRGWVIIRVEDDGVGFEPSQARIRSIENIRLRLRLTVGGTLELYSQPGEGTRAEIRMPEEEVGLP